MPFCLTVAYVTHGTFVEYRACFDAPHLPSYRDVELSQGEPAQTDRGLLRSIKGPWAQKVDPPWGSIIYTIVQVRLQTWRVKTVSYYTIPCYSMVCYTVQNWGIYFLDPPKPADAEDRKVGKASSRPKLETLQRKDSKAGGGVSVHWGSIPWVSL